MKRIVKLILIVALVALAVIQFIPVERNEGGYQTVELFEVETMPTSQVATILKNSCYDCHSSQTNYPWYAQLAPVSFWLADHIEDGKKHFNVSEWNSYSEKKKDHKLEELVEEVEEGEMPLDSYTWIHGNLSEEQKELVIQWAIMARTRYDVKGE